MSPSFIGYLYCRITAVQWWILHSYTVEKKNSRVNLTLILILTLTLILTLILTLTLVLTLTLILTLTLTLVLTLTLTQGQNMKRNQQSKKKSNLKSTWCSFVRQCGMKAERKWKKYCDQLKGTVTKTHTHIIPKLTTRLFT